MGDLFRGGNQKTIVQIDKDKVSTQEFINFVNANSNSIEQIDQQHIEILLGKFIGQKLFENEIKEFNIHLTDRSLANILKNQKIFMKNGKFSRTAYEKFLIQNNTSSVNFENNISNQETRNQLIKFISGGIVPSDFAVNIDYNKINQEREIELINLNDVLKKNLNFSENKIKEYFNNNKESYKIIYKSVKFIKLDPKTLTGKTEYSDLFFKKIDNIDDLIVEGKNLEYISNEFNLQTILFSEFNESGQDKNFTEINNFPKKLIPSVFNINDNEPLVLIESNDNYFLIELEKTDSIQRDLKNEKVRKMVLSNLRNQVKRNYISNLISKINSNNFDKDDFYKISKESSIQIKEIEIKNKNDESSLKKDLVNQIYLYPLDKVMIAADIGLVESFLVYIKKVKNKSINTNSKEYKKYSDISKLRITNELFKTYDSYLKNKYNVKINYNALDNVKNYF